MMGDKEILKEMVSAKAEPCYDTICERCLIGPAQKTTKPKNFNCRSCMKPIPPPKPAHLSNKGGGDLQTALVLKSIIDKLNVFEKQEKKPQDTDNKVLNPTVSQDHIDEGIDAETSNGSTEQNDEKAMCGRHPDMEVEGFCSDCGLLTCTHCAVDGHEHCSNLMSILEAIAFQKQNLSEAGKEKRREMGQFGLKTQFSVSLIKNEIENFSRQAERSKTKIRLQGQRLIRHIHEEEVKFINQVDKCYHEDIFKLKALKEIFDNFHLCGEVFMPVVQNQKDVTMDYLVKVDLFSRTMSRYNDVTEPQIPSLEFKPCKPQHIHLGVITIFHDDFEEINDVLE